MPVCAPAATLRHPRLIHFNRQNSWLFLTVIVLNKQLEIDHKKSLLLINNSAKMYYNSTRNLIGHRWKNERKKSTESWKFLSLTTFGVSLPLMVSKFYVPWVFHPTAQVQDETGICQVILWENFTTNGEKIRKIFHVDILVGALWILSARPESDRKSRWILARSSLYSWSIHSCHISNN